MPHVLELGHLVLYVRSVERSRHFYGDVLGWKEIGPSSRGAKAAAFSAGGRTHHELLLIEVGEDATPIPQGRRVGLYHFGLKIGEADEDLVAMIQRLQEHDVTIVGASDHTVTHSLYVLDPDGNELELYIDVQPAVWKEHPEAVLAPTKPLRLKLPDGVPA
jgi:catechol-2,3-dioxygenase